LAKTDIYLIQRPFININSIFLSSLYIKFMAYLLYDTSLLLTMTWATWQMKKEQQFTGRTGN